jgi:hypothetical protein
MTADEFERAYAARSGVTVAELRALGRVVVPCDCDYELCEGWQSVNADEIDLRRRLGLLPLRQRAPASSRLPSAQPVSESCAGSTIALAVNERRRAVRAAQGYRRHVI